MDNFIRRIFTPPKKMLLKFIHAGSVSADIGCGPGYFTLAMAELVGQNGKVYAVDSDPKSIKTLEEKCSANGLQAVIEAHTESAADMQSIPDGSVDFAFANGVLCCMANHRDAVEELKRILKPTGFAYLSVAKAFPFRKNDRRTVRSEEWSRILTSFQIRERGEGILNRWAIVSLPGSA